MVEITLYEVLSMFTGIIESIGTVRSTRPAGGGKVLAVDLGPLADGAKLGDSIAINGVCLTISRLTGTVGDFDVSGETLAKSTTGKLTAGSKVNLERAMPANGRFGGHIVLGHVDGTANIKAINQKGDFVEMTFTANPELLDEMVPKGSVAINGISLTIATIKDNNFSIALIPTTLKDTTLGEIKPGQTVNIETDMLIKAIKKQIQQIIPDTKGVTAQKLKEYGF
jgi:riboflavin synthase